MIRGNQAGCKTIFQGKCLNIPQTMVDNRGLCGGMAHGDRRDTVKREPKDPRNGMKKYVHSSGSNGLSGPTLQLLAVALSPILLSIGCVTSSPDTAATERARLRTEVSYLNQNLDQMKNRLDIVQEEQEQLLRELNRLRETVREDHQVEQRQLRNDMEQQFAEFERRRETERNHIIEQVTQRISAHLERTSAPAAGTGRTEHGRYHEVQAGETLSEIAAAYQVRANVIVQANDLENPDRLRIGQRLFIPD